MGSPARDTPGMQSSNQPTAAFVFVSPSAWTRSVARRIDIARRAGPAAIPAHRRHDATTADTIRYTTWQRHCKATAKTPYEAKSLVEHVDPGRLPYVP
jgi:hypothetical protein